MCLVAQSCPTICNPLDCRLPPGSSVHRIFQARMLEWVAFPPPGDLPNSGIEPCLLCLLHCQVDSLPTEPSGKPNIWWKFPKVSCCYFFLVFVFVVGNSSLGTEWTQSLAIEAGKWDMGPGGKHVRDFKPSLSPRVCSNPCPLSQCDEYYWSIKQNTDTCTTWMNLTLRPYIDYISVGRCQTQKRTYCIIPFIKKLKNKQSHFMVIDTRTKGAFGGGLGRAWHIMEWRK